MKNSRWMIALLLILIIGLTGCGVASGGQEAATEGSAAAAKPLDPAAWPTPQPSPSQPSPTPFPIVTLAPTATPTPRPEGESGTGSASPNPAPARGGEGGEVEALNFNGNTAELVQQVTSLSGGYPPVAAASVKGEGVDVRQEPASASASLGRAPQGELAAVLGKNDAGDWLYVLTRSGLQGWLPADALQITFSLGEAPVLPDDPQAENPASASAAASPLGGLEPAAVAVVTADNAALRQGPAASYSSASVVEAGELAGVLGTNAGRDWLYVITLSGAQGWLPADALRVMGSLDEAAVLPANPLATGSAPASPSETQTGQPQGLPLPAANAMSGQPLALGDLEPVAEARVDNEGLNIRQGPGAAYQQLGTLTRGDQVTVLALNNAGDWALVKTSDGQFGWVSASYLAVDGTLDGAPRVTSPAPGGQLSPGQVVPAWSLESGVPSSELARNSLTQNSEFTNSLTSITAHANRANVDLYRGPGTSYQPIVTLSNDETVSVLAVNRAGDWALAKPADTYKSLGWAPLEQLTVDGSLAGAPQVLTAWVESNALPIRRGPGVYYEQTGSLAINDMVVVLGVNQGRNWALVTPVTGGGQGWLPLNFLTLTGAWDDVPEASAPPVQPAVAPASQVAPATAGPGKLVFQTSSGGDIMVINPDGSGLRRLTQGIDPVLSPDGQTVAFTRWTGQDGTVWLINLDGSNERPVLGETKQAKHPAWSPDGQRIVVNFQHEGRLDPKEACQNLIELGDRRPDIPFNVDSDSVEVKIRDGRPFLCWTLPPDPHWGLRVVNVADGSYQDEPSDTYAFGPEWDPANAWRVVSSGLNGLVQLDVNRSEQWSLSDRREDHTPAFSPDGHFLAVAYSNGGHYDIHRLNADGSGRVALTETPLWVTVQPDQQKPWNNVAPAWSPDGARIAFLTDRAGRWEIWVMNADGSDQHPMFPAEINDQLPLKYNFVDERMLTWK